MQVIYKYPLTGAGQQFIETAVGVEPLSVQMQNGVLCLWALVDPSQPPVQMEIFIYGTGHTIYEDALVHIDTFQIPEQGLVFHVFRR